jgi:hypothetical protein
MRPDNGTGAKQKSWQKSCVINISSVLNFEILSISAEENILWKPSNLNLSGELDIMETVRTD